MPEAVHIPLQNIFPRWIKANDVSLFGYEILQYQKKAENHHMGEYVLLEVKIHNREDFQVGRIESVMDLEEYDDGKKQLPYGFVVCRLPVKKFRERCHHIRLLKKKTRRQNRMRSIDMKNNE